MISTSQKKIQSDYSLIARHAALKDGKITDITKDPASSGKAETAGKSQALDKSKSEELSTNQTKNVVPYI